MSTRDASATNPALVAVALGGAVVHAIHPTSYRTACGKVGADGTLAGLTWREAGTQGVARCKACARACPTS